MLELQVALDANAKEILFALKAGRFSNFQVPLKGAILRLWRRVVKQNYDGAGSLSTPRPWKPLKPKTIRDKIRLGYGGKPIMRRSDRLYRSLVLNARTADGIVEVTNTSLLVGTRVEYARLHQLGTSRWSDLSKGVPVRQVVPDPMPKAFGVEVRQILRDWIVEGKGA